MEIRRIRRIARALNIVCAAWCLVTITSGSAAAQVVRGDFNGDSIGDVAIGTPNEGVVVMRFVNGTLTPVNIAGAGTVTVIYGTAASGVTITSASPTPQLIHQNIDGVDDSVEQNDQFGGALAVGHLNPDVYDDLVVSVPGDNALHIFEGSQTGLDLTGDRMIFGTQFVDDDGLPLTLKAGLATGDFNGDGLDDLAIEATELEALERSNVIVMYSTAQFGPQFVGLDIFAFNNFTVELGAQFLDVTLAAGDFSGDGADDLAIGLPEADVPDDIGDINADAGAVTIMQGIVGGIQTGGGITVDGFRVLTEDDALFVVRFGDRFGSVLAVGDFDGDGIDDLAVGTPNEDVVASSGFLVQDGGFVAVFSHATTLHGIYTQLPLGLNPQAFDRFGAALASADLNGDGADDLAIGTPGDRVGTVAGAGSVTVLYGILDVGLPRPATFGLPQINGTGRTFTQATTDVGDDPETGDHFGQTLSAYNVGRSDHADLIIGVPDEDITVSAGGDLNGIQLENRADAGAFHVLYGAASGLDGAGSHFRTQNSVGVPDAVDAGDRFGSALP